MRPSFDGDPGENKSPFVVEMIQKLGLQFVEIKLEISPEDHCLSVTSDKKCSLEVLKLICSMHKSES